MVWGVGGDEERVECAGWDGNSSIVINPCHLRLGGGGNNMLQCFALN